MRQAPIFAVVGLAGVLLAALILLWPLNVRVWGACGSVLLPDDAQSLAGVEEWDEDAEAACTSRRREVGVLAAGVATVSVIFALGGSRLVTRRSGEPRGSTPEAQRR